MSEDKGMTEPTLAPMTFSSLFKAIKEMSPNMTFHLTVGVWRHADEPRESIEWQMTFFRKDHPFKSFNKECLLVSGDCPEQLLYHFRQAWENKTSPTAERLASIDVTSSQHGKK